MSRSSPHHHPHHHQPPSPSPYTDPDHPIPYRGPASSFSSAHSTQSAPPVDPSTLPDGGWGIPGPYLEGKARAQAMHDRGAQRLQNRAAHWVQQQAVPYPQPRFNDPPPQVPFSPPPIRPATISPQVPAPSTEVGQHVASEAEEGEETPVEIGPDGWPSPTTPDPELHPEETAGTNINSQVEAEIEGDTEPESMSTKVSPPSSRSGQPITDVVPPEVTDPAITTPSIRSPPPPTFIPALHGRPGAGLAYVQPYSADPNVLHVQNPRPWGTAPGVPISSVPISPSAVEDVISVSDSRSGSPTTARPDSAPPVAPAVTAYISEEEDEPAIEAQKTANHAESPPPVEAEAAGDEEAALPPSVEDWPAAVTPSPRLSRPMIDGVEANGVDIPAADNQRPKRHQRSRGPGSKGEWWKKEPHPAYSYEFADRRLLASFPYPFRLDSVKSMMFDHFSRYGAVRCVIPQQPTRDTAEQAIVVFKEAESIDLCLADPERLHCQNRSFNSISTFDIEIDRLPTHALTKTVFIQLSGARHDARARSASPTPSLPPRDKEAATTTKGDGRPLPAEIAVWAMPTRNRSTGRIDWWPRIFDSGGPEPFIFNAAREHTGQDPVYLQSIDLGRRTLEKDIVPLLCGFFGELAKIVPPCRRDQGWLISVNGHRDAERIMNEVGSIPGVTARWAIEADGVDDQTTPNRSPRSTLARFEKHSGGRIARYGQPLSPAESKSSTKSPHPHSAPGSHASVPPLTPPHSPSPLPFGPELPSEYPHLRKTTAPMYHGRLLRETVVQGVTRYIDEAAVFVGRLVKEKETEATLLQRFQKYGNVCRIEYRPQVVQNTYATARILYSDTESAHRAIQHEAQAVSFGSALKIEVRRVLPQDVRVEEIYIDELGRPVSPSMASQYSPPHHALVPPEQISPILYTLPPAMTSGPPPAPPLPPPPLGMQMPPGLPFPPQFWPVSFTGPPPPDGSPVANTLPPPPPPPLFFGHGPVLPPVSPSQPLTGPANGGPLMSPPPMAPSGPPYNLGYVPIYSLVPMHPGPRPTPPTSAPMTAPASHEFPSISTQRGETVTPPPPAQTSVTAPPQSPNAPKVVGYKSEKGVFKVVYDPDDLRRYQTEQGGPDEHQHQPSGSTPGADYRSQISPPQQEVQTPLEPLQRAHTSPGHRRRTLDYTQPGGESISPGAPRRGSLAPPPPPHLPQRTLPIPIPVFGHHDPHAHQQREMPDPAQMGCTPHEAHLAHMGYGYPEPNPGPQPHHEYQDVPPPQIGRQRRGGRGGGGYYRSGY